MTASTSSASSGVISGPVVPVWLAPWPSGGEVLVLTRDSLRTLSALGAAFVDAPATPTITVIAADHAHAESPEVTDAARDLVRRGISATTLHRQPSSVDGTRRRVGQVLAATGVLLLAFRPTIDGEYAIQTIAGLWVLAALPILRGAWKRAIAAHARHHVDALRLAFGAEVDRRLPGAVPPVKVVTHPPLATLAERLRNGATIADAARHARGLGLAALAAAYEPEARTHGLVPVWVPLIRRDAPETPDSSATTDAPTDALVLAPDDHVEAVPDPHQAADLTPAPDPTPVPNPTPVPDHTPDRTSETDHQEVPTREGHSPTP